MPLHALCGRPVTAVAGGASLTMLGGCSGAAPASLYAAGHFRTMRSSFVHGRDRVTGHRVSPAGEVRPVISSR